MRPRSYATAVTIVYIGGLFIQILDATIVNVALPALAEELDVDVTEVEWVVIGYALALASAIPAAGWLGDRLGSKRVFLTALSIFTVASALCGSAQTLEQLIAFRLAQGLGAGLIVPVGSAMLFRAYPLSERAKAANAVLSVAVIAPAIGPVLGGIIVETTSWRWIFLVNLPIGALALVLGWLWLEEHTEPPSGSFDKAGFVLAGTALALTLYGLSVAPDKGWFAPQTLLTGGLGVVLFAALVMVEMRVPDPVLDLALFGERLFRTITLVSVFVYLGFVSQIFLYALYLQRLRDFGALEAGLLLFPQALGIFLLSNLGGVRLYQRLGPRLVLFGASLGATLTTIAFAFVGLNTPLALLVALTFVRGVSMGGSFLATQTAVYARVSMADTAKATSLFNTQRQASGAAGTAVAATVLAALAPAVGLGPESGQAGLEAFQGAFLACGLMMAPAAAIALFIKDEDASETLRPPTVSA